MSFTNRENGCLRAAQIEKPVKMKVLVRFAFVILPYAALAYLALVWIAALYFYKDALVATHAKWCIPALFLSETMMHLRGGKS